MLPAWTPSSPGFGATFSSNPEGIGDPGRVGRDGSLSLGFERRGSRTVLSRCRFTLPLQVQRAVSLDDATSYLMLLNPTGGVLGGDFLSARIHVGPGARACLTTPSATRVYRALLRPAVQETHIVVAENAALEFLPDHVIPHAGSSFRQSLRVDLSPGGRAILFDSFAAGRIAHGERWMFRDFDSRTEIFVAGKPVFLNRAWIAPRDRVPAQFLGMEGFDYVATVILAAADFAEWTSLLAALQIALSRRSGVYAGVSLFARDGCVVRFLARTASDLVETNAALWSVARPLLLGSPAFDLRKY
ncbi:MAG TPA: urease accessory protein UreD [Verrucomicrobiae bacterium]|nr:urease accessory protein UreD [Verrucomicrobiae bacterium]